MSLYKTIEHLVLDGYAIIFEKHSKSSMTITLSNGCVLSRRGFYSSVMDDEDLSKILEYMKKDVDRRDAEYRKEKNMKTPLIWKIRAKLVEIIKLFTGHESIDEVNDSDTWPRENPNLGHVASYETYQPDNDILAKRFGIPCFTKEEI